MISLVLLLLAWIMSLSHLPGLASDGALLGAAFLLCLRLVLLEEKLDEQIEILERVALGVGQPRPPARKSQFLERVGAFLRRK